jgi:hypothetical protein
MDLTAAACGPHMWTVYQPFSSGVSSSPPPQFHKKSPLRGARTPLPFLRSTFLRLSRYCTVKVRVNYEFIYIIYIYIRNYAYRTVHITNILYIDDGRAVEPSIYRSSKVSSQVGGSLDFQLLCQPLHWHGGCVVQLERGSSSKPACRCCRCSVAPFAPRPRGGCCCVRRSTTCVCPFLYQLLRFGAGVVGQGQRVGGPAWRVW